MRDAAPERLAAALEWLWVALASDTIPERDWHYAYVGRWSDELDRRPTAARSIRLQSASLEPPTTTTRRSVTPSTAAPLYSTAEAAALLKVSPSWLSGPLPPAPSPAGVSAASCASPSQISRRSSPRPPTVP